MNMMEHLYETSTDSTEDITTSTSIEADSMGDTNDTKSSASRNSTDDDDTASFISLNSTQHICDATSADNQAKTLKVDDFEEYDDLQKLISAISRNHYMFLIVPNTVLCKQKSTLKSVINQKSFKTNEDIVNPILTKQKLEKNDHISKNKHGKKQKNYQNTKKENHFTVLEPKMKQANECNKKLDYTEYAKQEIRRFASKHSSKMIEKSLIDFYIFSFIIIILLLYLLFLLYFLYIIEPYFQTVTYDALKSKS